MVGASGVKFIDGLKGNVPDALMLSGVAGISYGAWLVYAPAGFIVGGAFLLAGGVMAARRGA
jgi:hypothetical protein